MPIRTLQVSNDLSCEFANPELLTLHHARQLLRNNMEIAAVRPMQDGFATVKQTLESTYKCLNIACAEMDGVLDETTGGY